MRGIPFALQTAGTAAANGTIAAIPQSFKRHKVTIKGSAGVASGAVQVETANAPDYTGTWQPIGGGPITVTASQEDMVDFEGVYAFIRARISTDVVGGTVDVEYLGGF